MSNDEIARVAIDDVVEAATAGVLRALEARNMTASDFTRDYGFFVKVDVTCGAWPGPIAKPGPLGPIVEESGGGKG
jgi:hypothetical protein